MVGLQNGDQGQERGSHLGAIFDEPRQRLIYARPQSVVRAHSALCVRAGIGRSVEPDENRVRKVLGDRTSKARLAAE